MADVACPVLGSDAGGAVRAAGEPVRAGLSWSIEEDRQMISHVSDHTLANVARLHGRTPAAIQRRLDKTEGSRNLLRHRLGVTQAAEMAGVSVQYIARCCRGRAFRAHKIDTRWVINQRDFFAWLDRRAQRRGGWLHADA
jgi:hypothetical protein